jgi:type IV pilus assembly protein PilP
MKRVFITIGALISLSGCTSDPDKSVINFIKETEKQTPGYIENVPVIPEPEALKYSAETLRDPFESSDVLKTASKDAQNRFGGGPDLDRPRELLESFPLDSLAMVGTLEKEGIFYALIKDSSDTVHLASVGNHIGENGGQIEKITETEIDVKEWLPDGKGGWQAHETSIYFSMPEGKKKGRK